MARIAGRNGRVYIDVAGGGNASPLPFVAKWTLNAVTDKTDVTAMGDGSKVYVAGLPDASGSFSGSGIKPCSDIPPFRTALARLIA